MVVVRCLSPFFNGLLGVAGAFRGTGIRLRLYLYHADVFTTISLKRGPRETRDIANFDLPGEK
jgi:hypothetical protein